METSPQTAMQYSCCDVCRDTCEKGSGKCASNCECTPNCACCTTSISTTNPTDDSDKKCNCKTDGVCTCSQGSCDCK